MRYKKKELKRHTNHIHTLTGIHTNKYKNTETHDDRHINKKEQKHKSIYIYIYI